jgi:hypothetical protein
MKHIGLCFRLHKGNVYEILENNLKIRDHLKDLGVDGEIIWKLILRKWLISGSENIILHWMSDTTFIRTETA